MLIVDTHHHIGVSPTCTFIAEDALLPWMDAGQIDVQFVFQVNQGACHRTPDWNPYIGNDYVAKIQRLYPDRVRGLATIHPWLQPPTVYTHPLERRGQPFDRFSRNLALEECHRAIGELGLHGVKMHPKEHGYPVNHSAVRAIVAELVRVQRQVNRRLLIAIHAAADSTYNTCEAVMDLCKDFPELLFLMVHSGYIWGGKTLASTVGPLDNVLFDLTTCAERATVLEAYERYGVERFVAGSDGPFALPAVKHAIVNSIFRTDEERAAVLGGTLAKLLDLRRPTTIQAPTKERSR